MQCSNCQTHNPEGAKFCMNCGQALNINCPNCGSELPSHAKFCIDCGHQMESGDERTGVQILSPVSKGGLQQLMPKALQEKLRSARSSGGTEGERRIVTILFCDVVGSTHAAEQLDPEDWTEIMNGAFEYLIKPVYHYEGTVARLMGDAILAFFGAPIAHEDDPQRAVLAGLEIVDGIQEYKAKIQQKFEIDVDVRVGINTGLVVIGEVGSDLAVEYTAMGDAVNLASRMESAAEPGTVQISAETHKLIAPLFEFDDLGGIEIKGKSEPVQAYRVLNLKTEPGQIRGIEGLDSPLIGRENDMAILSNAAEELQKGRGQIVSVMGEAGLGKSRLVTEFRQSLETQGLLNFSENGSPPADLNWLEGHSLSFETSAPFAPFIDILSSYFDLQGDQSDEDQYKLIKSSLSQDFPPHLSEAAPFIATLLDVQVALGDLEQVRYLEPPQLRERIFQSIIDFLRELTSIRPLVLVLDDLHWTDTTSIDLLERILALTDHSPLMLLAIFRPRRQEPSWRFHEAAARDYAHRYTAVELQPLDEHNSRELVANLLHVDDLPKSVRTLILAKAEGNPFFVEEVIRSLLDAELVIRNEGHWQATRNIVNIAVPDTLVGVITSRLDKLDENTKLVAQAASVIGRQFAFDTLAAITNDDLNLETTLAELQRRGLIQERGRKPQRIYQFKHALTQETVYNSLLKRRCQELHLLTAEHLERSKSERAGEIARHFLGAREHGRALPYLLEAGTIASRASSPEAIGLFKQALEILESVDDPVSTRRAYEGLAGAQTNAGEIPQAIETYNAMLDIAEANGDDPMKVSALNKMGFVTGLMMGQFPEAETHLAEAERLARQSEDLPGLAELHMVKCGICTATGDLDGAIAHLGESTQLGRNLNAEEPLLFGITHSANTLTFLARFDEAWERAQEARKLSEERGNQKFLAEILTFAIPYIQLRNGQIDLAHQTASEGNAIAHQIGSSQSEWQAQYAMALIARAKGEYEHAVRHCQQALDLGKSLGMPFMQMLPMCSLGTIKLEISEENFEQALKIHTEALKFIEHPAGLAWGSSAWLEAGMCLLAAGEIDRADEYFQKGLTVQTTIRNLNRPQLLLGAAKVEAERDQFEKAWEYLSRAEQFVRDRVMKNEMPLVKVAQAQLHHAQGERDQALENYEQAESTALDLGMRPVVWQARAGASSILAELGREEESLQMQKKALNMVHEIAALIENDSLKTQFLQGAEEKILAHAN